MPPPVASTGHTPAAPTAPATQTPPQQQPEPTTSHPAAPNPRNRQTPSDPHPPAAPVPASHLPCQCCCRYTDLSSPSSRRLLSLTNCEKLYRDHLGRASKREETVEQRESWHRRTNCHHRVRRRRRWNTVRCRTTPAGRLLSTDRSRPRKRMSVGRSTCPCLHLNGRNLPLAALQDHGRVDQLRPRCERLKRSPGLPVDHRPSGPVHALTDPS